MSPPDSGQRQHFAAHIEAYGVGSPGGAAPRVLAKLGDLVLDLGSAWVTEALRAGGESLPEGLFAEPALNGFMSMGNENCRRIDRRLTGLLEGGPPDDAVFPLGQTRLHRPIRVGDFCDFYASEFHASNMGRILRPGTEPLPSAWRNIPVGYHGRNGSVFVSGTPIHRPSGMIATSGAPQYLPTERLDLEVELGYVVGVGSEAGHPVGVAEARDHVFGVFVVNDWSARDIQAFEYQPLGPFLGKSFATSVSAWVTPLWALERFRVDGPDQGQEVPAHLESPQPRAIDIKLELSLNGTILSRPEARAVHWSLEQLVSHLTSNGASLRTGDLLATGTISGPDKKTWGSLMELAWAGEQPAHLDDGSVRSWIEDGDTVNINAWCGEKSVVLGEVTGTVLASGTRA